jgi:hypothetical protein
MGLWRPAREGEKKMQAKRVLMVAALAAGLAMGAPRTADAGRIMGGAKKAAEEAAKKKAEEAKKAAEDEAKKKTEELKQAGEKAAMEFALGAWALAKKKLSEAMPWVEKVRAKLEKFKDDATQAVMDAYEKVKEKAELIKEKGKEYAEAVMKEVDDIRQKLEAKFKEVVEKARTVAGKVMEHFKELFERAKAFGERVVEKVKEVGANIQEKVAYILNKAKEKARAAIELGQDLANRVTKRIKEGWEYASEKAKELGATLKGAAEKLAAKFEAIKGEKLADMQRMFMSARLKLEALHAAAPNADLTGELYVKVKEYVGKIMSKMAENKIE